MKVIRDEMKGSQPWGLLPVGKRPLIRLGSKTPRRRFMWRAMGIGPSRWACKWSMDGRFPISCATFICCGSTGATPCRGTGQALGWDGWAEARGLLASASLIEAQRWARRVVALTGGQAEYWRHKALREGRRHLRTGQVRFKTTSRLERQNREYRRREKMETVCSPHNLLILLQKRGLVNQTT